MNITPAMLELVNSKIPVSEERKRTVFDLSGVAHDEHAFTRWYEHFLNKDEDHGLADLFLQTLLSLTGRKLSISDYGVGREVRTKNGNFVDLLIYGKNEDAGKFVIIENKINHWLHNDLLDYWENASGSDHNKVGVLLTLNDHHIPGSVKEKFINVRHKDWLDAVINVSTSYTLTRDQNVLLSNFHNAILNLSKDLTMNEQILFFLNNIKTVNDIVNTKNKTHEYIVSQIDSAAAQLGFSVGGTRSEHYRTLHIPQAHHIYYTVLFHTLLDEGQKIGIVLEINGSGLERLDELDTALSSDIIEAKKKGMDHREYGKGNWVHYLSLPYAVDRETMGSLAEFIVRKINDDFSEVTAKAVEILKSDKTAQE